MEAQRLLFDDGFLEEHAGVLIQKPEVALVELVANAWDAGASRVEVTWPASLGAAFAVEDDGTGMTRDEFLSKWNHVSYSRLKHQGAQVQFPDGEPRSRRAYGSNGKGRHSVFCFADSYRVTTWRDGHLHAFRVQRGVGTGTPWEITDERGDARTGHGTRIEGDLARGLTPEDEVRRLLGSKFVTDPEFTVSVNGAVVEFEELAPDAQWVRVDVAQLGQVEIVKVATEPGRTARPHGLAWWVNGRLVGTPSWETLAGHLLDGRKTMAKSATFIIRADLFAPREDITADWGAFLPTERTRAVHEAVAVYVRSHIREELSGERRERKREILREHRVALRAMSPVTQDRVASFIDEVQVECPSLRDQDLENASRLLVKLEQSRTGYALLEKLAAIPVSDLEAINEVLAEWSPQSAKRVLDELYWRLRLIADLQAKMDDPAADELHHLQPLFEKGLWMLGPEFESVEFSSNRTLATVLDRHFGGGSVDVPRLRPDFVVLTDASLGVYSTPRFDERCEPAGYDKVVIVELKRGGSVLTLDAIQQAQTYAVALRDSGTVHRDTRIVCFVLGSRLGSGAEDGEHAGTIRYHARTYDMILQLAHARTFGLQRALEQQLGTDTRDEVLIDVLRQEEQATLELVVNDGLR